MLPSRATWWLPLLWCTACDPGRFAQLRADSTQPDAAVTTQAPDAGRPPETSADTRTGAGRGGSGAQPQAKPEDAGQDGGSKPSTPAPDAARSDAQEDADTPDMPEPPQAGMPARAVTCAPPGGRGLSVAPIGFVELARLQKPERLRRRVLGPSFAFADGSRTWLFSGTNLVPGGAPPAPRTPFNHPHAARSGDDKPWQAATGATWALREELDASGLPQPVLRLPENEPDGSITWEPISLVTSGAAHALLYLARGRGLEDPNEVYLAELAPGASELTNLRAAPLFGAGEPLFARGALRQGDRVLLFACDKVTHACKLARAPLARAAERAAYEFYARDAAGQWSWQSDVALATPVLERLGDALSFDWNRYLDAYLVVHGEDLSNDIVLESARTLEGPWTRVVLPWKSPSAWWITQLRQQPRLVDDCDKRVHISYFEPAPPEPMDTLPSSGDVVLGYVDLQ